MSINWRSPKELPKDGQQVWLMLNPHKERGGLLKSAGSIQIVCGEAWLRPNGRQCRIENMDEYGHGSIGWNLGNDTDSSHDEGYGIAWLPVEEMPMPAFAEKGSDDGAGD